MFGLDYGIIIYNVNLSSKSRIVNSTHYTKMKIYNKHPKQKQKLN